MRSLRISTWVLLALAIVPTAILACGSDDSNGGTTQSACVPGVQQACACPGGGAGAQRCNSDGTGFLACDCSVTVPDGGGADGQPADGAPGDSANDTAGEPSGPVLIGAVPANGGGPVGFVVEDDAVIVSVSKATPAGMGFTYSGSVVSMPAAGGGPVATLATGAIAPAVSQTGNLVAATTTDVFYVVINVVPMGTDTLDIMKKGRAGGAAAGFLLNKGGISSLQTSGGFLYWHGANVRRSPVGAASDTNVMSSVNGDALVVGANMYFGVFGGASARIDRVAVTGGGATTTVADSLSDALLSLAVDPTSTTLVYHDFSPNSTVYQAPVAGAATGTLVVAMTNDPIETPRIATDGTRVYYVSNKVLKSIPIGGGVAATDLVTTHDPLYVTNYGNHIYWYNRTDTSVWRMKKP